MFRRTDYYVYIVDLFCFKRSITFSFDLRALEILYNKLDKAVSYKLNCKKRKRVDDVRSTG